MNTNQPVRYGCLLIKVVIAATIALSTIGLLSDSVATDYRDNQTIAGPHEGVGGG